MNKVLLLSLLIPFCFIPSVTHADAKHTAGITTGVVSALSGLLAYAVFTGESNGSWGADLGAFIIGSGASLVSLGTGMASFALLNPTNYSSATVGKLEVAACSGLIATGIAGLGVKNFIASMKAENKSSCGNKNCPACNDKVRLRRQAKRCAKAALVPAAIAGLAVYSALDKNWHLKA